MKKFLSIALALMLIVSATVALPKSGKLSADAADSNYICLGYVANWAFESQNDLKKIDFTKLTHVNYAFALVDSKKYTPYIEDYATGYVHYLFDEIKRQGANTKVMLSIGGWGAGYFSEAASTDANRKAFAKGCKSLMDTYGFAGIDIDWEYPGSSDAGISSSPNDKVNFTLLCQEIRNTIGSAPLTMAGGASESRAKQLECSKLASILDFVNLMNYDYNTSNHASFSTTKTSAAAWVKQGFSKKQINIGVPFYARSSSGTYDWIEYKDIVPYIKNGSCVVTTKDDETYGTLNGAKLSFDTAAQITKKVNWVKEQGYGGVMCWELSQDLNNELLYAMASINSGSSGQQQEDPGQQEEPPVTPPVTTDDNVPDPTNPASSENSALFQNFNTMPAVSSTEGSTTPGTWSSAISSTGVTHGTFSQYTTSTGKSKLMKVTVGEGRYTINTYCGFSGADSTSKLTFKVWVPANSTVQKINSIKIGDTAILSDKALTLGAWNEIETSTFGGVTSGVLAMEFYSNPGAASQRYYIDDFKISKAAQSGGQEEPGQQEDPVTPGQGEYTTTFPNGATVAQIKAHANYFGEFSTQPFTFNNTYYNTYPVGALVYYNGAYYENYAVSSAWGDGWEPDVHQNWHQIYVIADTPSTVKVTGITLYKNSVAVTNNGSINVKDSDSAMTFTAAVLPGNATNKNYTITVNNNKVASVSGTTATVTPANATEDTSVVITAKSEDGSYTAKYTVNIDYTEPVTPPAQANIYVYKLDSSKVYYKNGDLVLDAGANVAVKDTRTMVPIRAFSFTAGVTDLEYASGVITFTGFEGYTVTMTVGSTACKLTKKGAADINLTLSSAPTIINGSTMVPLRDATVVVGGQVEYNNGYIVVSSDTFNTADIPSYISAYDKKAK